MSNRIKAKGKKKTVNVFDLIPAAYHTWDSETQASWCVKNAIWMQEEGIELEAPGISVEFDGDDRIVINFEIPEEGVQS